MLTVGSATPQVAPSLGLHHIRPSVFVGANWLRVLTLPDGFQTAGHDTFRDCLNLEKVVLPASFSAGGVRLFHGCVKLSEVTFVDEHATLRVVDDSWFFNCRALTTLTLPPSVVRINEHAFAATGLTTIWLPATLQQCHALAFTQCAYLVAVHLPAACEIIYDSIEPTKTLVLPEGARVHTDVATFKPHK